MADRDLRREIAKMMEENPEFSKYTVDQLLAESARYDLGVWSEVKRGYKNAEFHWEWYDLAQNARRLALIAPREHAKALALDTPVLTPRGHVAIADVEVGDTVLCGDGWTTVTAVSPIFRDHDCYRVTLDDGQSFVADAGHLWNTHYAWRGQRTVTTEEIVADHEARSSQRHVIDCVRSEFPTQDLPMDPYVLGAWLGDGSTGVAAVTVPDAEIVDLIEEAGYKRSYTYQKKGCVTYGFVGGLLTDLRLAGVLYDKHVPDEYLWGDRSQRLELLRGLCDTDGSCSAKGQVVVTQKRKQIRDAVTHLVWSLGWKPKPYETRAKLNGVDHGPVYGVAFYPDEPVFRVKRKRDRQRKLGMTAGKRSPKASHHDRVPRSRRSKATGRAIVSVEPTLTVPVKCITTGAGTYLIGEGVVTHNSECFTVNNAAWHSVYNPGFWTYIFCNSGDQGEKILSRVASAIAQVQPELLGKAKVAHAKEIVLWNDARITVRGSGAAVRGAHPDLIIGDDVQDETNCMSQLQRDRLKQWWFGTVGGMAHPGTDRVVQEASRAARKVTFPATRILLVGTPFHSLDLLMSCKDNPMYQYRLYSAITRLDDESDELVS